MRCKTTTSNSWAVAGLVGALTTTLYFLLSSSTARAILFTSLVGGTCVAIVIGLRLRRPEVPRGQVLL
ncbi:MAG: hypothetical protein ACRDJT_07325, partial [Actinomycetota bacterium]